MKIEVTENDISLGKRGSRKTCPVALAISRATLKRVSVENGGILLNGIRISHTHEVRLFIDNFDMSNDVWPFSFSLSAENFIA